MFATTRFPQLGFLAMLLAGCANTAVSLATDAPASAPETQFARITAAGLEPVASVPAAPGSQPATAVVVPQTLSSLPATAPADAASLTSRGGFSPADLRAFADEVLATRDVPASHVYAALAKASHVPQVVRLMTPARPGGPIKRSWITYRSRFVEPIRIRKGKAFMAENSEALARAERTYGVPGPVIAAIIGVETIYGGNTGNFSVLDALATLAFDYPEHPNRAQRVKLFREQLADFLVWTHQSELDPGEPLGSFAGAIGLPQFMPTSILHYAVDGDGDGHIDLQNNPDDAIMSVGNFLRQHGWVPGLPVFSPVRLTPEAQSLADGGLEPRQDWAALQAAGARLQAGATPDAAWLSHPLGVVDLREDSRGTAEYRTATPNFYALTKYNRSYFYATAVSDLSEALQRP